MHDKVASWNLLSAFYKGDRLSANADKTAGT
jgi:hypothetical protein